MMETTGIPSPFTFTLLDKTSSIPTSDIYIFLSNRVNPLPPGERRILEIF